eukprot:TRINITY_DN9759_c0_g1_i2.p1 TRINITY_DN9759_c0_g1~~TRINITY_DN9759_c0_g1_i2.p1  ORF type:complete len:1505 (+),score=206.73 TRINITY_DN9759_c0_g1_i2:66-4580(+)
MRRPCSLLLPLLAAASCRAQAEESASEPYGGATGSQLLGCYADSSPPDLPIAGGSATRSDECSYACENYTFFSLQAGDCFCGTEYGKYGRAAGCDCGLGSAGKGCVHQRTGSKCVWITIGPSATYNSKTVAFNSSYVCANYLQCPGAWGCNSYDPHKWTLSQNPGQLTATRTDTSSGGWDTDLRTECCQLCPMPTEAPTTPPTAAPTAMPTGTGAPTPAPTAPTASPSWRPTQVPTTSPPTASPTISPTAPTASPTRTPTRAPSRSPSEAPSQGPTSGAPTAQPTKRPLTPTGEPSGSPSGQPSSQPTAAPSTQEPTQQPSLAPTAPTTPPTAHPSAPPRTAFPSGSPRTAFPTDGPTPSRAPTAPPRPRPTRSPTPPVPTAGPSRSPRPRPSQSPARAPTAAPAPPSEPPTSRWNITDTGAPSCGVATAPPQTATTFGCSGTRCVPVVGGVYGAPDCGGQCRLPDVPTDLCTQHHCAPRTCHRTRCVIGREGFASCSETILPDGASCRDGRGKGHCRSGACEYLPCSAHCAVERARLGWHAQCVSEKCAADNQTECDVWAANNNNSCGHGRAQTCYGGRCVQDATCRTRGCDSRPPPQGECMVGTCVESERGPGCLYEPVNESRHCDVYLPGADGKGVIDQECRGGTCMWLVRFCVGHVRFWRIGGEEVSWHRVSAVRDGAGRDARRLVDPTPGSDVESEVVALHPTAAAVALLNNSGGGPPGTVDVTRLVAGSSQTADLIVMFEEPIDIARYAVVTGSNGCPLSRHPIAWTVDVAWFCKVGEDGQLYHTDWLRFDRRRSGEVMAPRPHAELGPFHPIEQASSYGPWLQCVRFRMERIRGACRAPECGWVEEGNHDFVLLHEDDFIGVLVVLLVLGSVVAAQNVYLWYQHYFGVKSANPVPLTAKAGNIGGKQARERLFEDCWRLFIPLKKMWEDSTFTHQGLLAEMLYRLRVPEDSRDDVADIKLERLRQMYQRKWSGLPRDRDPGPTMLLCLRLYTMEAPDIDREMDYPDVPKAKIKSDGTHEKYNGCEEDLQNKRWNEYKTKYSKEGEDPKRNVSHYSEPCALSRKWASECLFKTYEGITDKWIKYCCAILLQSSAMTPMAEGHNETQYCARVFGELPNKVRAQFEQLRPGDWMALTAASSFAEGRKARACFMGDFAADAVMLLVATSARVDGRQVRVGAGLRGVSMYPEEHEVLFPMFGMMEVTKVRTVGSRGLSEYIQNPSFAQRRSALFRGLLVIELDWKCSLEECCRDAPVGNTAEVCVNFFDRIRRDAEASDARLLSSGQWSLLSTEPDAGGEDAVQPLGAAAAAAAPPPLPSAPPWPAAGGSQSTPSPLRQVAVLPECSFPDGDSDLGHLPRTPGDGVISSADVIFRPGSRRSLLCYSAPGSTVGSHQNLLELAAADREGGGRFLPGSASSSPIPPLSTARNPRGRRASPPPGECGGPQYSSPSASPPSPPSPERAAGHAVPPRPPPPPPSPSLLPPPPSPLMPPGPPPDTPSG